MDNNEQEIKNILHYIRRFTDDIEEGKILPLEIIFNKEVNLVEEEKLGYSHPQLTGKEALTIIYRRIEGIQ